MHFVYVCKCLCWCVCVCPGICLENTNRETSLFSPSYFIDFWVAHSPWANVSHYGGFGLNRAKQRLVCGVMGAWMYKQLLVYTSQYRRHIISAYLGVLVSVCLPSWDRFPVGQNRNNRRLEPFIKSTAPCYPPLIYEAEGKEITQHKECGPQWTGQSLQHKNGKLGSLMGSFLRSKN